MTDKRIEIKLMEELRVRNSRLMAPHIFVLTFFGLYNADIHYIAPETAWAYPVIFISLIGRYIVMKKFFSLYEKKNVVVTLLFHFFVMMTGLGWGLLYWNIERVYGILHINSLLCLGLIFTLMSGGVTAFASSVKTAVLYIMATVCIPGVILWIDGPMTKVLSVFIFANAIYQIYHTRVSHKFLGKSIETEIAATNQKEILQEYINALPGIVGVIGMDGTYLMINNYLNGEIRKLILGTKVGDTLKGNAISEIILDFIQSPETHLTREVYSPDLSGNNWYMVNLKKISTPQEGVIASILPINELVETKNELKIQEARSQYAAKLASLGEFSASIAHEVNNPLTIISGAANQLKGILKESPQDIKSLNLLSDKIQDTTQRISRIIRSLKMLSGDSEDETYCNVTFASIVEPALEITKQKVNQMGIKLQVEELDNPIELFGNEIQLSQVIMNLVSNAIDAVKDSETKNVMVQYRTSLEWLDILVTDSGPGVSDKVKPMIMDPFFSTKEGGQGTGLGLSISKGIVERHQGTLELLEGLPTTFRVRLPRMT